MTSKEIRQQFLDFFKNKDHRIIESAPVVPYDDPTLLFTNAGMNQFKDVFLGQGTRDYKRAADTQKCIRVSGKHNDLEEVGRDTYHHTFFEMLGNWSFGDYYKKEAITWAWELLTDIWKLPKERLWATVYRTDDESFDIWQNETDINPEHILRFDEKDNFWEMGEVGPCGPCSEIHINISDDYNNPKWVNAGVPECIEIWNLVFIQNNRDKEGKLHDLPEKHVDTGMGFERIVAVLQNKSSNYETDIFSPIIDRISKLAGLNNRNNKETVAVQVIADHIRTLAFAIADGATPGNEGRGYVLRRILRRAARFGRNLDFNEPFLFKLVDVVVKSMADVFPEIKTNQDNIKKIIRAEEVSFNATLDRGIELFEQISKKAEEKAKAKEVKPFITGEDVFKLYDTFGFPVDLTNVMAEEKGMTIDEDRFDELMAEQKKRARGATKNRLENANVNIKNLDGFDLSSAGQTKFTGYSELDTVAKIIGVKNEDDISLLIFDKTPFYVEAGGQIDDNGKMTINGTSFEIFDLTKIDDKVIHYVKNPERVDFKIGTEVELNVSEERRWDIMRNHSATHLMNAALREVLGNHVQQSGSYVGPDRLRFGFTHYQRLTQEEIQKIEEIVNEKINEKVERVQLANTPFDEAKKMGALMFFGDKYGDKVNVIKFGEFSKEFCGGTHVLNSSDIKYFKIVSESSIASGVRRIEAVTGFGVVKYLEELEKNISDLNSKVDKTAACIQKLQDKLSDSDQGREVINEISDDDSSTQNEELEKLKKEFSSDDPVNIDEIKQFIFVQENLRQKLSVELERLNDKKRKLEKKNSELDLKSKLGGINEIINSPTDINGINLFRGKVDAANMDELKSLGDELRNKMNSGVGALISAFDEKVGIVCVVSDDLIKDKNIKAGDIVGSVAKIVGGGGGGRPHLATAGGRDISKIDEALSGVEEIVNKLLK